MFAAKNKHEKLMTANIKFKLRRVTAQVSRWPKSWYRNHRCGRYNSLIGALMYKPSCSLCYHDLSPPCSAHNTRKNFLVLILQVLTNMFQCVIVSSGRSTYALYLYENLEWPLCARNHTQAVVSTPRLSFRPIKSAKLSSKKLIVMVMLMITILLAK